MKFEFKKHWWIIVALVAVIYFIGMKPEEQRIGGAIPILQMSGGGAGYVKACNSDTCNKDIDCKDPNYPLCYESATSSVKTCCNFK